MKSLTIPHQIFKKRFFFQFYIFQKVEGLFHFVLFFYPKNKPSKPKIESSEFKSRACAPGAFYTRGIEPLPPSRINESSKLYTLPGNIHIYMGGRANVNALT